MPRILRHAANDPPSRALAAADPELGALIDRVGMVEVSVSEDGFEVLAESIVSQQLSWKAAATIWRSLERTVGTTAAAIANASHTTLRAAGLSARKAEYVQGIARAALSGELDFEALEALDDESVIEALVPLRGVGRWTAQMYLIFALGRPDVLAVDDYGVRSSAGRMAGLHRPMERTELASRGELWRPFRTSVSLWLWAAQD